MARRGSPSGRIALVGILLLVAWEASATIINPGFEVVTTSPNLEAWTFTGSGPFSGGASTEFVTQGVRNGRLFSQCALGSTCPSFAAGQFGSLQQAIDFTGVQSLILDVQLRQGGGAIGISRWDSLFKASILVDATLLWTSSAAGTLDDLTLNLPTLFGIHVLAFRLETLSGAGSPSGSNHFNFDNLRSVGTAIPEPASAALTLFGLLVLGGRRRSGRARH